MKVLFALLALSLVAILVTVGAMWLRLRWHLRRSPAAAQEPPVEIHPEREPEQVDAGTN